MDNALSKMPPAQRLELAREMIGELLNEQERLYCLCSAVTEAAERVDSIDIFPVKKLLEILHERLLDTDQMCRLKSCLSIK